MEENNKRTKKMEEQMKEMKESIDENNKNMKEIMNKMILKDEAEGMINKVQQDFLKEAKRS